MKHIKLFESKSLEDKFLDTTKEIIDLIWDVVEGYEDDGKFEDVQIGVLAETKSKSHELLCCIGPNPDGSYTFNEGGLVLFEAGNPIEYSIDCSTKFQYFVEMYEELISRLSSLYDIKYSKIYYLNQMKDQWKLVYSETDVTTLEDLATCQRGRSRAVMKDVSLSLKPLGKSPFNIRFRIEK